MIFLVLAYGEEPHSQASPASLVGLHPQSLHSHSTELQCWVPVIDPEA